MIKNKNSEITNLQVNYWVYNNPQEAELLILKDITAMQMKRKCEI